MREADWPPDEAPGRSERERAEEVLDRKAVLGRVLGNVHLFQELVKLFLGECPGCLAKIRESISQGKAGELRAAADFLQGSVANFGSSPVYEAARKLEAMGRSGDLTGALEVYLILEKALHQLQPVLAGLALEPTTGERGLPRS